MRFTNFVVTACLASLWHSDAADQSVIGPGNIKAIVLAERSPLVQSARRFLQTQAGLIRDPKLREATLDIISNPATCVTHRAGLNASRQAIILKRLSDFRWVDPEEDKTFPNGLRAGVFPPLMDDDAACPKLPQPFYSAPGSSFGGHHSYPGGLMLHEAANEISALNLAESYRRVYGSSRADGLPVIGPSQTRDEDAADVLISQDILIAAPIWHDWAKAIVFQWNSDGTEFQELSFGGSGAAKTGAHHILGIAEAIKRGLPPAFVMALASAHSTGEETVVSWIRTAAVIAEVDPVERGYLWLDRRQSATRYRRAAVRNLGDYSTLRVESALHNLSDADFTFTGPAVADVQKILADLAPQYGFNAAEVASYNNGYRNVVLSYFSAERLLIIYGDNGLDGVEAEIDKIRPLLH